MGTPAIKWDDPKDKATPTQQTKPEIAEIIWDEVPAPEPDTPSTLGFLGNIPKSGGRMLGGIASAIVHPIQTAKGLYKIGEGAVKQAVTSARTMGMENAENTEELDAFVNMLKERYGGLDEVLNTMYDDPVGFAADLSVVAGGTGAVAKQAGQMSKVGALTRTGRALEGVGAAVDPLRAAGRMAAPLASRARAGFKNVLEIGLGKTTGKGSETLKTISAAGEKTAAFDAFKNAMRGGVSADDLLNNFKSALQEAKEIRGAQYRERLSKFKVEKLTMDISPVRKTLEQKLKEFGISRAADGSYDFSRSTIQSAADQNKVLGVIEDVYDWGKRKGDRTPLGVDTLKRRLGDFYADSSQARGLVTAVKNSVRDQLNRNVPGYAEMTSEYAAASNLIEEVEKGLSLGGKRAQTALTKLQTTLKENNAARQVLVETLEQYVGDPTLKAQLAGYSMKSFAPQGIVGALAAGEIVYMISTGMIAPKVLVAMATHSPRLVGELMVAIPTMEALSGRAAARLATTPPGSYRVLQVPEASESSGKKSGSFLGERPSESETISPYRVRRF